MFKKFLIFSVSFLIVANADANVNESFIFKPAITLEYQFPKITSGKDNGDFKNESAWDQIKGINNIVLGFNFRIHKYLGINANWSQFDMENSAIDGYSVASKANLKTTNYNISSLLYLPIIGDNLLEGFVEIGASDMGNKLKLNTTDGNAIIDKSHETALLYGIGIQFAPYDLDTVFRLSVQKYNSNYLSSKFGSDLYTYRAGIVQYF